MTTARIDLLRKLLESTEPVERTLVKMLPDSVRMAQVRCAIAGRFDAHFYDSVVRPFLDPPAPTFEEVLGNFAEGTAGGVRWFQREYQLALLAEVSDDQQAFVTSAVDHYHQLPDRRPDVVRLLLAIDVPRALAVLREEFGVAEDRGDIGLCEALLQAITRQWSDSVAWRSPASTSTENEDAVGVAVAELRGRLAVRKRWLDVTTRTGHTFIPRYLEEETARLLDPKSTSWLREIHALGGAGKTSYLRWLLKSCIARPHSIPCAMLDFDFIVPEHRQAWRLLLRIIEDLDVGTGVFGDVLRHAKGFEGASRVDDGRVREDAGESDLERLQREVVNAFINTVQAYARERPDRIVGVIVLDTVEEVVEHASGVKELIEILAQARARTPGLRVIIAGRFLLSKRVPEFAEAVGLTDPPLEVRRFTSEEAKLYLTEKRRFTDDTLITSIVEKAKGLPMLASLLADLCQSNPELTPNELLSDDSAEVKYLILRVIDRIPDKALRWVVRYGAIPDRLTRVFVDEVMAPFIENVFEGRLTAEDPHHLLSEVLKKRVPFPIDLLQPGEARPTVDLLWEKLCSYAGDASWITRDTSEPNTLVVHPYVREPMRKLLEALPVTRLIREAAVTRYFERSQQANWSASVNEAIVHAEALGEPAIAAWQRVVREARTQPPAAHMEVAERWLSLPHRVPAVAQALGTRHTWDASLEVRRAVLRRALDTEPWRAVRDLDESVRRYQPPAPPLGLTRDELIESEFTSLALHLLVIEPSARPLHPSKKLLTRLCRDAPTRTHVQVGLFVGWAIEPADYFEALGWLEYAVRHASELLPTDPLRESALMRLAGAQMRFGRRKSAQDTLKTLRDLFPGGPFSPSAADFGVTWGFAFGSNEIADTNPARRMVAAREAITERDGPRLVELTHGEDDSTQHPTMNAGLRELRGFAAMLLCDADSGWDHLRAAAEAYRRLGDFSSSARCTIGQLRIALELQGDVRRAASLLSEATSLAFSAAPEVKLDLQILQLLVHEKRCQEEAIRPLLDRLSMETAAAPPGLRARVAIARARHFVAEVALESLRLCLVETEMVEDRILALLDTEEASVPPEGPRISWVRAILPPKPDQPWTHLLSRAWLARYVGDHNEARAALRDIEIVRRPVHANEAVDLLRAGNAIGGVWSPAALEQLRRNMVPISGSKTSQLDRVFEVEFAIATKDVSKVRGFMEATDLLGAKSAEVVAEDAMARGDVKAATAAQARAEAIWTELGDEQRARRARAMAPSIRPTSLPVPPSSAPTIQRAAYENAAAPLMAPTVCVSLVGDKPPTNPVDEGLGFLRMTWGGGDLAPLIAKISSAAKSLATPERGADVRFDVIGAGAKIATRHLSLLERQVVYAGGINCVYRSLDLRGTTTPVLSWFARAAERARTSIVTSDLSNMLVRRELFTRLRVAQPGDAPEVLIVSPDREFGDYERAYGGQGFRGTTLDVAQLDEWLRRSPSIPTVVHVVAHFRELRGVHYLSDRSGERRWSVAEFSRMLRAAAGSLCVFDLPAPGSMLFTDHDTDLRDGFAAEFFETGTAAGVLAMAGWQANKRKVLVQELKQRSSLAKIIYELRSNLPTDAIWPVLFAHEPRLFFGL